MDEQKFRRKIRAIYDAVAGGIKFPSLQDQEKMAKLQLINDKIIKRNISDQEQILLAQVFNKRIRNNYIMTAAVFLFQPLFFLVCVPDLRLSYSEPQGQVFFFLGLFSILLFLSLFTRFSNKKKDESDVMVFDALVLPVHGITEKCLGVTLYSGNEKIFVRKNKIIDKEFFKTLKYWSLKTEPYRITMMEKSRIILLMEPL